MVLACGMRNEGSDFPKQKKILHLALRCCYCMLLTAPLTVQKIDLQKRFFTLQVCYGEFHTNSLPVLTHVALGWPKLSLPVNNLE